MARRKPDRGDYLSVAIVSVICLVIAVSAVPLVHLLPLTTPKAAAVYSILGAFIIFFCVTGPYSIAKFRRSSAPDTGDKSRQAGPQAGEGK